MFAKIVAKNVAEQDFEEQWAAASKNQKSKLLNMLAPDNWKDEVPESVMELLGILMSILPKKQFKKDVKELHDIYKNYCFSSSGKIRRSII